MVETGSSARDNKIFDGVQCLRFVAALMVVLTHSTFYAHERLTPDLPIWERGALGVDIFFVISGFVMWMASAHLQGVVGGGVTFLRRRAIRIVPLYWLVTTVKLAILLAAPAVVLHSALNWPYIAASYFFIPAFNVDGRVEPLMGVGWTLIFEVFFYVVFAAALFLRVRVLPALAVVMAACAIGSLFKGPGWPAIAVYLDFRVLEFLTGVLIARFTADRRFHISIATAAVAIGFGLILFAPVGYDGWRGTGRIISNVIPSTMIVFGVVALEAHFRGRWPKAAMFLGSASYSLYLVHPLVAPAVPAVLAKLHLANPLLSVIGSLSAALVAAIITYLFFEKPVTRWLGKQSSSRKKSPAIASGI